MPRGGATSWSSNFGYLNAPRSATGLTQLGARAYDPGLGKFISPDPLLDLSDPRQLNGYSYSLNSPVSYSDASGLIPLGAYDRGDASYRHPAPKHTVSKSTTSAGKSGGGGGGRKAGPPAAGGSSGSGTPSAAQPEQWWNPFSWTSDTWVAVGAGALMTVAGVGIAACVVATAGICAAVGVGTGALALGAVGAGTNLAAYELTSGEKTAEGALVAFGVGGALGVGSMVLPGAASGVIAKGATMRSGGSAATGAKPNVGTISGGQEALRSVDDVIAGLPEGRSSGVRTVESETELTELYSTLSARGSRVDIPGYPGYWVRRSDGVMVGLRDQSKSGGQTIDIRYPDGKTGKVHIG